VLITKIAKGTTRRTGVDHVDLPLPTGVARPLLPCGCACWTLDETPEDSATYERVGLMLPRDFWRACKQHDWAWESSDDQATIQRGRLREYELKRISEETHALRDIWERFNHKRYARR
jgi:hypothetical protein